MMKTNISYDQMLEAAEVLLRQRRGEAVTTTGGVSPNEGSGISEEAVRAIVASHDAALRSDFNQLLDTLDRDFTKAVKSAQAHKLVVQDHNATPIRELDGALHKSFHKLAAAVQSRDHDGNRLNVWLPGPMGGGKSTACRKLAEALGLGFDYTGQVVQAHQVEGYVRQGDGQYMSTAFVRTFEHGGVWVGEEADAWFPQPLLIANPPLANGYMSLPDGRVIKRHPDCIIIMCANTWGNGPSAEYVGRNRLDAAFLDRFGARIEWTYDEGLESKIVDNSEVVDFVQQARYNAQKNGVKVVISPRVGINIAALMRGGFSLTEAAKMTFLAGLDRPTVRTLVDGTAFESDF